MSSMLNPLYLSVLLAICICCSRQDDDMSPQRMSFQEGDNLMLDEGALETLFPLAAYRNSSAVVFVNGSGQEFRFPIVLTESIIDCPNDMGCADATYTASTINIELIADDFPNYEINFSLESIVNAIDFTFDNCVLMKTLEYRQMDMETNPLPLFEVFQVIACLNTYEPSGFEVETLGTVYEDVIVGGGSTLNDGFRSVYYTTELGLAVFQDETNEFYVFDRFEN